MHMHVHIKEHMIFYSGTADITWLRSNVSNVKRSESLSNIGEDSFDLVAASVSAGPAMELGDGCLLLLPAGCHFLTFLAMASTAWPAAILVSQDLLVR